MRAYGRLVLAVVFALVFGVTVLFALSVAVWGDDRANSRMTGVLQVVMPAELALLGAATAWFYAS